MADRPKSVRGKLLLAALAATAAVAFVWLFRDAPGPILVWIAVPVVAIATIVLITRHRRIREERKLAAFEGQSFSDAARRMRARNALVLEAAASDRPADSTREVPAAL